MPVVDVEIASAGRRVSLPHVLPQNVHRPGSSYQNRAHVADQRLYDITRFEIECVGRGHRLPLLAERSEDAADDLRLPEKIHDALFERPSEAHEVIDVEQLLVKEAVRVVDGSGGRFSHALAGAHYTKRAGSETRNQKLE